MQRNIVSQENDLCGYLTIEAINLIYLMTCIFFTNYEGDLIIFTP